jgi:hypothetical protein
LISLKIPCPQGNEVETGAINTASPARQFPVSKRSETTERKGPRVAAFAAGGYGLCALS